MRSGIPFRILQRIQQLESMSEDEVTSIKIKSQNITVEKAVNFIEEILFKWKEINCSMTREGDKTVLRFEGKAPQLATVLRLYYER